MFRSCPAARLRLTLSAAGLVLGIAGTAAAETEPIRLDYRAPASSCPSAVSFTADVLRRTPAARAAAPGEDARTFVIVIESRAAGFAGSLTVREGAGVTVARRVLANRCSEVAEALALSTALAVDPSALTRTEPAAVPGQAGEGQQATAAVSKTSPTGGKRSAESRKNPAGAPSVDAPAERALGEPATTPRSANHWAYALRFGPDLRSGNSPRAALGGSASLEARPPDASSLGAIGVELGFLQSITESVDGASSSFQFVLARPYACWTVARPSPSLRLMPCFVAELGMLTGRGSDLPEPATERRFWAAAEIPLRAELELSARSLLGLSAGVVVPATRYRFSFLDPDTAIYDIPPFGFAAGVKFGVRL
jgi:hypothetical protein